MRFRLPTILSIVTLAGCSAPDPQSFSVYFQPYSSILDQQAKETVAAAANFAQTNQKLLIAVSGYSAPPDPNLDVDGLSAQRADAVKQALAADGVGAARITTIANGVTDPKTLPTLAVRRVDITIGRPDPKDASGNATPAGGVPVK